MPELPWARYRTPSAYGSSTFLCGACAGKQGLSDVDIVEEPDPHELPLDCHDCGQVLRTVGG